MEPESTTSNPSAQESQSSSDKRSTIRKQQAETRKDQALTDSLHAIFAVQAESATKEDLLNTSARLEAVVPDGYQSWRLQADFLLAAIAQLETRQIEPDGGVKIIGVPLLEDDLREAAEKALRNCAHFAQTDEEHTAIVDEANRVRRMTWF